jgi:acetyl-CoA carboxylase carboxyl transferase subunit alpha
MQSKIYLDFEKPIIELERRIQELKEFSKERGLDFGSEISKLEKKSNKLLTEIYSNLSNWQRTQLSRHMNRPYSSDYINYIFTDFFELHGDRNFMDDKAIISGVAQLDGISVAIIAQQKGRNTKEKIFRNFGMPKPEGYRKALRIMNMAERYKLPVITFIDTPGAYPGVGAEERGQAEAIAKNLLVMAKLETPMVSIVIGEGGSGGALAIGITDRILMLEHSIYSVISPESCASILWRDTSKAEQSAKALKLTAPEIMQLGIIDEMIKEPDGGAHRNFHKSADKIKESLLKHVGELIELPINELLERRFQKYRKMGVFEG